MKLIYIDEAGNTGRKIDPAQPEHILVALIVDESQVRTVESAVQAIAQKYHDPWTDPDFEFHGHAIRGGRGPFKALSIDQRIAVFQELIAVVNDNQLGVGYAAIHKAKQPTSKHPHDLAFLFLVERIQDYLASIDALGLLIADENKDVEQRLIQNLDRYKAASTGWGWRPTPIRNVVDSLHFVQSHNNKLIQLADIIAYIMQRGRRADAILWEGYFAVPFPRPQWQDWVEHNATPSQKVDYALYKSLPAIKFGKAYP